MTSKDEIAAEAEMGCKCELNFLEADPRQHRPIEQGLKSWGIRGLILGAFS